MISPISAPSAREMIIIMVPWVPRAAESPAAVAGAAVSVTVSIFDIVLPSPITITAKPMDFVTVSRMRSRMSPLETIPINPPATIAAALTIVPVPIIGKTSMW